MSGAFAGVVLAQLPELGTTGCTNFSSWLSGAQITSIPASYNFASATTTPLNINALYTLQWIYATPPVVTHNIGYNALSKAAIDDWFTRLPIVVGQTVTVTGNPGASTCDTSIAMLKGWIVVT